MGVRASLDVAVAATPIGLVRLVRCSGTVSPALRFVVVSSRSVVGTGSDVGRPPSLVATVSGRGRLGTFVVGVVALAVVLVALMRAIGCPSPSLACASRASCSGNA